MTRYGALGFSWSLSDIRFTHSINVFLIIVVRSLAAQWRRGRNAPLGTYFFGVIVEHVMLRIRRWPSKVFLASLAAMRVSFAFAPNSFSKLPTSSSGALLR